MRENNFINGYFYHIYNRGVDKRRIFEDEKDYFRFIHCLYEFNDISPASPYSWILKKNGITKERPQRKILVDILCFCLMPNHFHLILQQKEESGITKFMRKLGTGYTMYFNEKYKRTGVLFEGTFKSILIQNDEYLIHLSRYIHINCLDLIEPKWKENGIQDWMKAREFLCQYRWSSLPDYLGEKNFPSVTQRDFIKNYFKSTEDYNKFVFGYLPKDLSKIEKILLE